MIALAAAESLSPMIVTTVVVALPLILVAVGAVLLTLFGAMRRKKESRQYSLDAVDALAGLVRAFRGRPEPPPSRPSGPD